MRRLSVLVLLTAFLLAGCKAKGDISVDEAREALRAVAGNDCRSIGEFEESTDWSLELARITDLTCGPPKLRPGEGGPVSENPLIHLVVHKDEKTTPHGGPLIGQRFVRGDTVVVGYLNEFQWKKLTARLDP